MSIKERRDKILGKFNYYCIRQGEKCNDISDCPACMKEYFVNLLAIAQEKNRQLTAKLNKH